MSSSEISSQSRNIIVFSGVYTGILFDVVLKQYKISDRVSIFLERGSFATGMYLPPDSTKCEPDTSIPSRSNNCTSFPVVSIMAVISPQLSKVSPNFTSLTFLGPLLIRLVFFEKHIEPAISAAAVPAIVPTTATLITATVVTIAPNVANTIGTKGKRMKNIIIIMAIKIPQIMRITFITN